MTYFISKNKQQILSYEGEEIMEYEIVGVDIEPKIRKTKTERNEKPEKGSKGRDIEICVREGLSVKESIVKLAKKYPTIKPMDVYVIRSKMKKGEPSDSFTGKSTEWKPQYKKGRS